MAKITVDVEALRSNKSVLDTRIQEIEQYNGELKTLIEQIKSGWSGKSADSYYTMMWMYTKHAEEMKHVLEQFRDYVNTAANKFETMDQNAATRIRNSF